jgi:general secretion pathway protein D
MIRRSVSSGIRRPGASPRAWCAHAALALLVALGGLPRQSRAQPPALQPPVPAQAETPPAGPETPTEADQPELANAKAAFADVKSGTAARRAENTPPNAAPPRESADLESALLRRGDLNLHGLSLNSALFTISEQWNINIVAGNVEGTVNGVFKQAPLREILDSILLSNGYNYRVVGKSLVVSSVDDLGQINPFFQSATIPVQSADIDEVVEGAKLLNTPQGQVKALKSVRSIVVLDFPDRVKMIREFVAALDGASGRRFAGPDSRFGMPLEVAHFRTQHIRAVDAEKALQAVLSSDGRVTFVPKEDRLVIIDYAENLAIAEKVLLRIDQPRPQVRITALIYDISLQDIEQLGLNWNKIGYDSDSDSGFDVATSTAPFSTLELADGSITSLAGGMGNIAFGTLNRHFDINAVVLALRQARDARLLADPNVAVLENEQALFRSVREIPIQQLTETAQGGNIGTTAFREAGIKLTVTPKIASDCTICMEVAPEFSRFVGNDENGQPIIDTREAKTTLRVANRQTIVIGGLRQRDDIGDFNGIPYLKDLKYVGRLFRSRSTTVRESELVVFIMPEIISCDGDSTPRQQIAEETLRCRLDQIPEAEGCPPCCRRLPPEMIEVEPGEPSEPPPADGDETADDSLPSAGDVALPPLAASQIPSAEFQFGVAGRNKHVRTLVAEGRLRRLPTVTSSHTQLAERANDAEEIFPAPSTPASDGVIRTADGGSSSLLR